MVESGGYFFLGLVCGLAMMMFPVLSYLKDIRYFKSALKQEIKDRIKAEDDFEILHLECGDRIKKLLKKYKAGEIVLRDFASTRKKQ